MVIPSAIAMVTETGVNYVPMQATHTRQDRLRWKQLNLYMIIPIQLITFFDPTNPLMKLKLQERA